MNQTSWENVQKSRTHHTKVITISVIAVAAVAAIIILNNNDLISGKSENANTPDSTLFSFDESELTVTMEGTESDDTGSDGQSTENQKDTSAKIQKNQPQKKITSHSQVDDNLIESNDNHKEQANNKASMLSPVDSKLVSGEQTPDERIPKQFDALNTASVASSDKKSPDQTKNPLKEQVFLLTNVQSRVIDRKDLIISLALELFYTDSIAGSDLRINRDALRVVALKVLQDKPLASLKKEQLAEDFKTEMNGIFERKTLIKVRIREFHIKKVSEQ